MNTYTVIGLNPEADMSHAIRDATFLYFIEAPTPTVAGRIARRQRAGDDTTDPDDIAIIAVFEGSHNDHYEPSLDTAEHEAKMTSSWGDRYRCANCGHTNGYDYFSPAKDITKRFVPGDIYTNVECPKCGALALPVESEE